MAGCEENQVKFDSQFDHIILLSARLEVLTQRLPLLRAIADCEIDTTMPLSEVGRAIVQAVGAQPPDCHARRPRRT